jgi:hypothetical protein
MLLYLGLSIEDWSILRKFDYLIDALTFDFVPKDMMVIYYPYLVEVS